MVQIDAWERVVTKEQSQGVLISVLIGAVTMDASWCLCHGCCGAINRHYLCVMCALKGRKIPSVANREATFNRAPGLS